MEFNDQQKNEFYRLIGEMIRAKRNARNWLQEDLANRCGIARTTLINIEKGSQSIPLHSFISISKALGCNFTELLPNLDSIAQVGKSDLDSKKIPPKTASEINSILGN